MSFQKYRSISAPTTTASSTLPSSSSSSTSSFYSTSSLNRPNSLTGLTSSYSRSTREAERGITRNTFHSVIMNADCRRIMWYRKGNELSVFVADRNFLLPSARPRSHSSWVLFVLFLAQDLAFYLQYFILFIFYMAAATFFNLVEEMPNSYARFCSSGNVGANKMWMHLKLKTNKTKLAAFLPSSISFICDAANSHISCVKTHFIKEELKMSLIQFCWIYFLL